MDISSVICRSAFFPNNNLNWIRKSNHWRTCQWQKVLKRPPPCALFLKDTDLYFLTLSLMSNTGDSNSCVFHPMVVGVQIFPAVVHIVRTELVVAPDIPDEKHKHIIIWWFCPTFLLRIRRLILPFTTNKIVSIKFCFQPLGILKQS